MPNDWGVHRRDGADAGRVVVLEPNPFRGGLDAIGSQERSLVICWSGSLADDDWSRDWATWGAQGAAALRAWCERVAPGLDARASRLALRPHARHVLSDPFKCRRFVEDNPVPGVGVALDAASMMEHSMLPDAPDHFARAFEMLGGIASAVFLTGVEPANDPDAPPRAVPVGRGVVPPDFLRSLVEAHVPPTTPLLLMGDPAPQLAALGADH